MLDLVLLVVGEDSTGLWKESHLPSHQGHVKLEQNNKNRWELDEVEQNLDTERSCHFCRPGNLESIGD